VELKKSHFGKPPLTECALRRLPCQSELAEAPRATKACHEVEKMTLALREPTIHPEGNAIHG